MKRSEIDSKQEIERMDKVNLERLDDVRNSTANAVRDLSRLALNAEYADFREISKRLEINRGLAKIVNSLENAVQNFEWHCEWFDYDTGTAMLMDDAIADLGPAMSELTHCESEFDDTVVQCSIRDAVVKLSKALATLIRWDDDDEG